MRTVVFGCLVLVNINMHNIHKSVPTKSRKFCSVPQCSSYCTSDISLHKFPLGDRKLCLKWKTVLKIGKSITQNMHVCSLHFQEQDYCLHATPLTIRRKLKKGVIPSQKIPISEYGKTQSKARSERKWLKKEPQMEEESRNMPSEKQIETEHNEVDGDKELRRLKEADVLGLNFSKTSGLTRKKLLKRNQLGSKSKDSNKQNVSELSDFEEKTPNVLQEEKIVSNSSEYSEFELETAKILGNMASNSETCLKCKNKTDAKCSLCDNNFRHKCQIIINETLMNDGIIICCPSKTKNIDQALLFAVNNLAGENKAIDINTFNYVVKQKDAIIQELRDKINIMIDMSCSSAEDTSNIDDAFFVTMYRLAGENKVIDISIFNYVIKQKDTIIQELQEKFNLMNKQFCFIKQE